MWTQMETLSQNNTRNTQVVRLVQSALLPAEVLSFQTHTHKHAHTLTNVNQSQHFKGITFFCVVKKVIASETV